MSQDFSSLAFKLDISDADQKINVLSRRLGTLQSNAEKAAKNVSAILAQAFSIEDVDASPVASKLVDDFERANAKLKEIQATMKYTQQVAEDVSKAIARHGTAAELEKDMARLKEVSEATKAMYDDIEKSKKEASETSFVGQIDMKPIIAQRQAIGELTEHINAAIKATGKPPTERENAFNLTNKEITETVKKLHEFSQEMAFAKQAADIHVKFRYPDGWTEAIAGENWRQLQYLINDTSASFDLFLKSVDKLEWPDSFKHNIEPLRALFNDLMQIKDELKKDGEVPAEQWEKNSKRIMEATREASAHIAALATGKKDFAEPQKYLKEMFDAMPKDIGFVSNAIERYSIAMSALKDIDGKKIFTDDTTNAQLLSLSSMLIGVANDIAKVNELIQKSKVEVAAFEFPKVEPQELFTQKGTAEIREKAKAIDELAKITEEAKSITLAIDAVMEAIENLKNTDTKGILGNIRNALQASVMPIMVKIQYAGTQTDIDELKVQINDALTQKLQPLLDQLPISASMTVKDLNVDTEPVKARLAEVKQSIEKIIASSDKMAKDKGLNLPPIAFEPPATDDIDAGLKVVRDYIHQADKRITLPRPKMLPPTKENISQVIVETRKAFREEHIRMTNLIVEGPSQKELLGAVKRAREFLRENTVRMKIAGFDGSEKLAVELDDLAEMAKNFKDTITIPKVPEEVMRSLDEYKDRLEAIAKAIHIIEEDDRRRAVVANALASQNKKAQAGQTQEMAKQREIERESMASQQKNLGAMLKLYQGVAEAQIAQSEPVQTLNAKSEDQLKILAKVRDEANATADAQKKVTLARVRADKDVAAKQTILRDNQLVITETLDGTSRMADKASKSIKQIALNPQMLSDPLQELKVGIKQTDSAVVNLAKSMGLIVSGRAVIGHFKEATRKATQFSIELHKIISLEENFSFDMLSKGLMEIDARLGNAIHNAQTLYWAYSSGVRGTERELVRFTETMAKTALTISASVIPTMDAATSLMNAFGLKAKDATEVGDLLFKIVKEGKSHGAELASSIGHVVASAASLGLTMDELGAATATLTRTIRTSRSLTYLNNILGKMISPTENVRKAAERMGLDFSMAAIRTKGFAQVMKEVREATQGNAQAIAQLFPDLRSQRAAITLLGTQYEEFEKQLTIFSQKAGSMEQAYATIADTPEKHFEALRNALAIIGIEAGRTAMSFATLGGALQPVIERFNKLSADSKKAAGRMATSAGIMGSMVVAQKALTMAQYASAQAAVQNNMLEIEGARVRTDSTEAIQKQLLEIQQLTVARKQEQLASRLNDDELKRINAELETNATRKAAIKISAAMLASEKELAGVRSSAGIMEERELAALRKSTLANYKLLIAQTKHGADAVNLKLDDALRLEIQERINLRNKEIDLILKKNKLEARDDMREDVIYAGSLKVGAQQLRNEALEATDADERAMLEAQAQQSEAIANQVLNMVKGYHMIKEETAEAAEFNKLIDQYTANILLQSEQINKAGNSRVSQMQVTLAMMEEEFKLQDARVQKSEREAALRHELAANAERATLMVQGADLKWDDAQRQAEETLLLTAKLKRERELGITQDKLSLDLIKARVQEMTKESQIFATNNKHMLANAELEVKTASVRSGRRGAIVAEAKANEMLAQSEEQLLHMKERIAEIFKEQGVDVTAAQLKELEAIESQIDALREKNRQLQKGNELTLIGLGKSLAIGKKGLDAGIDGKDVGRIAGMVAGRAIAAYIGPGAAVISMLPMGKVMNTLKSAIGTATAGMVLWNKTTMAHTVSANLDKVAILGQTKAALSSSIATLLASGAEKELAATRAAAATATTSAMGIIGVAAGALFALLSKTQHGGPMRGIAEQVVGLEALKESLDNEAIAIQHYEERKQVFAEISNTSKAVLSNINAEVKALRQQKTELERAGAAQESINNILERLAVLAQQQADILSGENYLKLMRSVYNRTSSMVTEIAGHQEQIDQLDTFWKRAMPYDSAKEFLHVVSPFGALKRFEVMRRTLDRVMHGAKKVQLSRDAIDELITEQDKLHEKLQGGANIFYSAQAAYMEQNVERIRNAALITYKSTQDQSEAYRAQLLKSAEQLPIESERRKQLNELSKKAQEALVTSNEARKAYLQAVLEKDKERTDEAEKHYDEAKNAYDEAHQNLEKYQQKINDQADKFFRDFNQWVDSLPKAITDTLNESLGQANYDALMGGESSKINAIQQAILTAKEKQKEYGDDLSLFMREHLSQAEAEEAQQKAILEVRKIERDQTIALHQIYTQIFNNLSKMSEDVGKKMRDITKAQWDRAIANPLSMFSRAQINEWASGGQGVLATIIGKRTDQLRDELKQEQATYGKLTQDIEKYRESGQIDLQAKATQDLMQSYEKHVNISNEAIEAQRKLADAEAQAGKSAYDLALSITRLFKDTTQQAFKAESSEALRLMSRTFATPVQLDVKTQEQDRLNMMMQALDEQRQRMLQGITVYLNEAKAKVDAVMNQQFKDTLTFQAATAQFDAGVASFKTAVASMPKRFGGVPQTVNATPANR